MPIIQIKVSGNEDTALAQAIASEIGRLTLQILNKKPEVTVVIISFVPQQLWFINASPLTTLNQRSFYLDINISDSTNVKTQKSAYISAIHLALSTLIGNVNPVSYTAIHEVRADAYGYEGLTIEHKIISNQLKSNKA